MKPRTARGVARSLVVLYVILAAAGLSLQAISNAPYIGIIFPALVILIILVGIWVITGALIIARQPYNPVGWLLCVGLFTPAIDMFAAGYAAYDTYVLPGGLPGVELALVWLNLGNLGALGLLAFILIILLFPDGKFLTARWRKLGWFASGALLLYLPLQALEPGPVDPSFLPDRTNPLGVSPSLWAFLNPPMWIAFFILSLCYAAALLSLLFRLRRSRGEERQQIKWLISPAWLYGIFLFILIIGTLKADDAILGIDLAIGQIAAAGMIIAIAFAIFKFRLYDIDLIINKTLVYGALSGTLVLIYLISVILLQQILPAESPVAIVLSTLATLALFSPLRRRIQNAIDKRFYRRKYDAEKTLEAFATQLRQEVDLDEISRSLLAVATESMQPDRVSLWVKSVKETSSMHKSS
jgi:hypothetical protein